MQSFKGVPFLASTIQDRQVHVDLHHFGIRAASPTGFEPHPFLCKPIVFPPYRRDRRRKVPCHCSEIRPNGNFPISKKLIRCRSVPWEDATPRVILVSPQCLSASVLTDPASCRGWEVCNPPILRPAPRPDMQFRFLVREILSIHATGCRSCLCRDRWKAGRSPLSLTASEGASDVTADTSVPPIGKRKHKV